MTGLISRVNPPQPEPLHVECPLWQDPPQTLATALLSHDTLKVNNAAFMTSSPNAKEVTSHVALDMLPRTSAKPIEKALTLSKGRQSSMSESEPDATTLQRDSPSGYPTFEDAPCPLCGTIDVSAPILIGQDDFWQKPGAFPVVSCLSCQMVFQSPRPSPQSMSYFYEGCYDQREQDELRKLALDSPVSLFVNGQRLKIIEGVVPLNETHRVIDVGCSYGAFIELARRKRGFEAYAIDVDPGVADRFVNTEDIALRCGELRHQDYPADFFDVVTMFETLEHVYGPVEMLREVERILKPGGVAVLEVPNWDSWTRRCFGSWWFPLLLPQHLQHFTRRHLARCCELAGLKPVHQQCNVFPAEIMLSLWVGLSRTFGRPKDKSLLRRAFEGVVTIWLVLVFLFVDLPVVFLLSLIGRSGHQTIIARKARPDDSP